MNSQLRGRLTGTLYGLCTTAFQSDFGGRVQPPPNQNNKSNKVDTAFRVKINDRFLPVAGLEHTLFEATFLPVTVLRVHFHDFDVVKGFDGIFDVFFRRIRVDLERIGIQRNFFHFGFAIFANDFVALLVALRTFEGFFRQLNAFFGDEIVVRIEKLGDTYKTAIEIYEGQQWDMDYECRNDVTVDEYINMIRLKTSVLLGCALKTGALIAGADDRQADLLYQAGVNMGMAFQLRDDVLDVWGDPATFGKEIGGDIMNNKKTFLLINAMHLAQGDDADELRHWLNDPYATRDNKVAGVTALYERLGVRQLAEDAITHYNDLAIAAFNQVKMSDADKQAFIGLANRLSGRTF